MAAMLWSRYSADRRGDRSIYVMTHSSFRSPLGPGPILAERFKRKTRQHVEYIDAGDAGLLIQRRRFIPRENVDIILGLDQLQLEEAIQAEDWIQLPRFS